MRRRRPFCESSSPERCLSILWSSSFTAAKALHNDLYRCTFDRIHRFTRCTVVTTDACAPVLECASIPIFGSENSPLSHTAFDV